MATYATSSIDISKIKIRWTEPYTSEGSNRQMSVLPRGIYRGGDAGPMGTPSKSLRIGPDIDGSGRFSDSCFVVYDDTNAFSVIIIDQSTVEIDMSARFTAAGGTEMPGNETWWIWTEASYATGVASSASYVVSSDTPSADVNVIAKVNMLSGDTTITEARFDRSVKTLPIPDKIEDGGYVAGDQWYGMLSGDDAWNIPTSDQKRAMNSAATSPTSSNPFVTKADTLDLYVAEPYFYYHDAPSPETQFQLSGYFYVGNSSVGQALKYFSCRNSGSNRLPYLGSENKRVYVSNLLKSDGVTTLNPSVDADDNGFYSNPYVVLSDDDGLYTLSEDIYIYCFIKKLFGTLSQEPAETLPNGCLDLATHMSDISGNAISGTPDSLTGSNAQQHLSQLLDAVNDSIKTNYPDGGTPTSSWTLIWRNDNTTNINAKKTSISFYTFGNQWAIVMGGYLSGVSINFIAGTGDSSDHAGMIYANEGSVSYYSQSGIGDALPAGTVIGPADWDSQLVMTAATGALYTDRTVTFQNESNGINFGDPTDHPNGYMRPLINAVSSSDAFQNGFFVSDNYMYWTVNANAIYDASEPKFAGVSLSKSAYAISLANSSVGKMGIRLLYKDYNDADFETGWASDDGWTSELVLFDDDADKGYFTNYGTVEDTVNISWGIIVYNDLSYQFSYVPVTWHSRIPGLDTGDVTINASTQSNINSLAVSSASEWGADIAVQTDDPGVSDMTAYFKGTITVQT